MPQRDGETLARGISVRRTAASLLFVFLLSACVPSASTPGVKDDPLLVAAAASLEAAFTEIGAAYEAETGRPVDFVFGSSGNLTTQIENGAPFDVFASADEGFVDRLASQDLILHDTQVIYAQGRLVLVVNQDNGLEIVTIDDLADPGVLRVAIANPELAPYGAAARQALQRSGLWEAVAPKIVQGANVRQALQYVQTGDAPVGLTALSIADVPEVTHSLVDAKLYEPLNQALATVASTGQETAAREFAAYVLGSAGQSILTAHGFTIPEGP